MERGNGASSGAGGTSTTTDGGAGTAGGTSTGPNSGTGTGGAGTLVNPAPQGGGGGGGRNATEPRPSGSTTHPDGSRTDWETDQHGSRVMRRYDADGNSTGGSLVHGDEFGTPGVVEEFGPGEDPIVFGGSSDLASGDRATVTEDLPGGRTRTASTGSDGSQSETITDPDGSSTSQSTRNGEVRGRKTTAADGSSVYEGLDSQGAVDQRITTNADGSETVELRGIDGEMVKL